MSDDAQAAVAFVILYLATAWLVAAVLLVVGLAWLVLKLLELVFWGLRRLTFGPPNKRERRRVRREHRSALRDIEAIRWRAERHMARAARKRESRQIARW